ncbi:MAG: SDR family oxidoreductase [Candidatus Neomarinimicrobiota bacterium]|nr:SDR family oxidoreductase [Candidatus Neomarinimicrobiota bacterium]
MNIDLTGRTALVCGSTQGIGKESAIRLAKSGARVILAARDEDKLQKIKQELDSINQQNNDFICADFDNGKLLFNKVKEFLADKNTIHILVNNSGGPSPGSILESNSKQFIDGFNRHLINNHNLSMLLIPGMKSDSFGRIINVISISVKQPIPNLGVSNTIRGAVASWAKTLSYEVAPYGITVNNILPGFTNTGRLKTVIKGIAEIQNRSLNEVTKEMESSVPSKRFAEPSETAAAITFLASDQASYINGINLPVDGGRAQSL